MKNKPRKTNRIAINIEDSIYEAIAALAEKEGLTVSELGRSIIVTELIRAELLPDNTIRDLMGIRS